MTWSPGAHLVKGGFDLRTVRQDAFRDVQARGQLAFTPFAYTGNGLADLLLGLPTITVGATLDNPQRLRTENVGLFVQDQWRATGTLTLTAGIRYELTSAPVDAADPATIYEPGDRQPRHRGHKWRAARRVRIRSQQFRPAPRLCVVGHASNRPRGAYGIYYNLSALAPSRRAVFQRPVLPPQLLLPGAGLAAAHALRPVPGQLSNPVAAVWLHVSARPENTLPAALQHQGSSGVLGQREPSRSRLRQVARSSLITGRDLIATAPMSPNLGPEPVLRRHHNPRVGRSVPSTTA